MDLIGNVSYNCILISKTLYFYSNSNDIYIIIFWFEIIIYFNFSTGGFCDSNR